ncbi:ketopantoate reductase family protein [Sporolactobacillus vineae]|uniref:ketopantoate reductase family protein n=1 Tax=Sporolactobacillus vineae TaxID=444463 RepID=UPI000287DA50|nr:ketopantoate reductase family protein [Sporolactobacillus vineae]
MKIAILGVGAIGGFFGGLLAKNKLDVTFIARGKTLERLRSHPLEVKSIKGDFSLQVEVLDAGKLTGDETFDIILLAVKSTALQPSIEEIKKLSGPQTEIICLLNGIGNEEKLAETFGPEHIVGGSAFISVIREAPGVVNHVGEGTLVIGEWKKGKNADRLVPLIKAFSASGIKATVSENIRQIKWEKLLWNIIYNPLTALTGTRVGEALEDPDLNDLFNQVKQEFLATARAVGIQIRSSYVDNVLLPDPQVQNHKTSMLQDFENGRKMELEAILGFVVQTAGNYHVPVTTIDTLYHLLRFAERSRKETEGNNKK